jgi:hypothetical protein
VIPICAFRSVPVVTGRTVHIGALNAIRRSGAIRRPSGRVMPPLRIDKGPKGQPVYPDGPTACLARLKVRTGSCGDE